MLRAPSLVVSSHGLKQYPPSVLSRSVLLPARLRSRPSTCSAALDQSSEAFSYSQASAAGNAALSHAEQLVYSLADSAVVSDPSTVKRAGGWVQPLADGLETVLKFFQSGLDAAHVPYSYGFSIILLVLTVKLFTFPLTKQQVESAMAVQSLKPRIDLIKKRFGEDKDKISKETNVLYEQAGVNPLAGCLPTLATIPIFIGLYSSLTNAATEGLFDTEGFFWLPSLAGPTSIAARQAGTGTAWLFPFVDGHPPIGWDDASRYLLLPVLLVLSQYLSNYIVSPPIDPEDPNANTSRALQVGLPLMIGYFSLNVPAGLSLYYFCNSAFTMLIQIYLKKLGGANVVMNDLGPVTKPGSGRRTGVAVPEFTPWTPLTVVLNPKEDEDEQQEGSQSAAASAAVMAAQAAAALDSSAVSRRVKRKKLALIARQAQGPKVVVTADGSQGSTAAA